MSLPEHLDYLVSRNPFGMGHLPLSYSTTSTEVDEVLDESLGHCETVCLEHPAKYPNHTVAENFAIAVVLSRRASDLG